MDELTAQKLPLAEWLGVLEREYFAEFVPQGGGALKLAVAPEEAIGRVGERLAALARRHGMLAVPIDAARTRLHLLQDVFFALARALDWEALCQRYVEALFGRNGFAWPRPGARIAMAELADAFAVAPPLLARERDGWLSRDIWEDRALAQDFRAAVLRLCLAQLEPEAEAAASAAPVLQWLRGEKLPLAQLRAADISVRITRHTARAMLVSLCHWVRKCGAAGLLLLLDIRPLARLVPAALGDLRYTPAAVMDTYEVLREIIDDAEHLPGLLVAVLADDALIAGDPRRALSQYAALQMRVWPDVRPGDRQNPAAPLVWVAA